MRTAKPSGPVEHDQHTEPGGHGRGCGEPLDPEEGVGGVDQRRGPRVIGADQRVDRLRGGAVKIDRAEGDVEAEAQMARGGPVDVEAAPLEQDREVFGLLHLDQEHPFADRVQHPGRHEDGVAGVHLARVEEGVQLVDPLIVDEPAELLGIHVTPKSQMHDPRLHDVPGLGLAVRVTEVAKREGVVGVRVHRQSLPGVEELHEQAGVAAVALRVSGAEPSDGIALDGVAQRAPTERGEPFVGFAEERGRGCHPVLGGVRGRRLGATETGDPLTAGIEPVAGLVGGEGDGSECRHRVSRAPRGRSCAGMPDERTTIGSVSRRPGPR